MSTNQFCFYMQALEEDQKNALVLQEMRRTGIEQNNREGAERYLTKMLSAGTGEEARLLNVHTFPEHGEVEQAGDEMQR